MNTAAKITAAQWQASAALFSSLCDPAQRALTYRALIAAGRPLLFASRANACDPPSSTGPDSYAQHAWLITRRRDAVTALRSSSSAGRPSDYSNAPFGALGRHNFMLGMDAEQGQGQGQDHASQRAFAQACLSEKNSGETHALCTISLRAAAVLPLKKGEFDGVQLAEQTALRFVAFWFGFAQSDLPLLQACTRKASHALSYQTFARHFATDPLAIAENSAAMAALSRRAAELIDLFAYQHTPQQRDAFKALASELQELRDFEPERVFEPWPAPAGYAGSGSASTHRGPTPERPLSAFEPVMRRMAGLLKTGQSPYGGTDLANLVTGLIAGTVGNVVSSVALALRCLFADNQRLQAAIAAAGQDWLAHGHQAGLDAALTPFVWEALRLDPPVAFLPRRSTRAISLNGVQIAPGSELLIAVGAATRDHPGWVDADCFNPERDRGPGQPGRPAHDPLIFGGEPDDPATGRASSFLHQCIGQHVAMPLITHIVRQMLLLPGLAEAINPRDGKPLGLSQQWAYHCLSYPLVYHRHELLRHSALLLLMDLHSPSQTPAQDLRSLLEQQQTALLDALQQSGCVHFAAVLLLNSDTQLALFAFIDQDINNHLPRLAQAFGPVLSPMLAHVRHAPPAPVAQHPWEFEQALRRFNRAPVGDYVFCAYPNASLAMVQQEFDHRPARLGPAQHPLLVSMPIKAPAGAHAEQIKQVIAYGAPRIEKMLRESRHVHFACFVLLNGDSELMLFTVFDRGFEPYVEHFALQVGSLFDRLFEHMLHAPPVPVDEFPQDFVELIRRFDRSPEVSLFFTAHANAEAAQIQRAFTRKAQL